MQGVVDGLEELALHGVDPIEGHTTDGGPGFVRVRVIVHELVREHERDDRHCILASLTHSCSSKGTGSVHRSHVRFVSSRRTSHDGSLEQPQVMEGEDQDGFGQLGLCDHLAEKTYEMRLRL